MTARSDHGRSPRELAWVSWGLGALVVLHIVVPVIMALRADELTASIRAANPALSADNLRIATLVALSAATAFHLVFAALYVWLGIKVSSGRRWARIALTVVLLAATGFSAVSFVSSPMFRYLIPFGDVLQLALAGLLWLPRRVREHFGATTGK